MHLEVVNKLICRYTWRPWSSKLRNALWDRDNRVWTYTWRLSSSKFRCRNHASLEIHLEAVIEWDWRCTWRPQLSEFGYTLDQSDRVNSVMHLEAVIEWVWRRNWRPRRSWTQRCTWRPQLSGLGNAFGGRERVPLRCTWKPWSSEFGDALAGYDRVRSEEYLEAVDRRRVGCWDSIHQLINLQSWEYDEVISPFSLHGELAGGARSCTEACRKLKLHLWVNS